MSATPVRLADSETAEEGGSQAVKAQQRLRELILAGDLPAGARIAELALVERLGLLGLVAPALLLILVTMLLAARFIEKRDSAALTAFCFSALLLAQVRYESVIWLLPVTFVVLWVWAREGRAILSWPVIFAPLLNTPSKAARIRKGTIV